MDGKFHLVVPAYFNPEFLAKDAPVKIGERPEAGIPAQIISIQNSVIQLNSLRSSEDVSHFVHAKLWVLRSDLNLENSRDFMPFDFIGAEVILQNNQQIIGQVREVLNFGASDIVEIFSGSFGRIKLPMVEDFFDTSSLFSNRQLILKRDLNSLDDLWEK